MVVQKFKGDIIIDGEKMQILQICFRFCRCIFITTKIYGTLLDYHLIICSTLSNQPPFVNRCMLKV